MIRGLGSECPPCSNDTSELTCLHRTFGAMLALLSKPRTKYRIRNAQGRTIEKDAVTSLMIVPYRDLAYQILNWIESIVKNFGGASSPELSSIAQVLVRDGQMHL